MGSIVDNGQVIDMADYLFKRLRQLGVDSMHGVPGDYSLVALDYLKPNGIHWVGNANELVSGYAADGYARMKGIAALTTPFGVGELSALNAIGGSYAEKVPVVHIVGSPPVAAQDKRLPMHHSLGNGDFRVMTRVYKEFTCAQAELRDPANAPALIDETLRQCLIQSLPVYIELPLDRATTKVSASRLAEPISVSPPPNDESVENAAVDAILGRLRGAKQSALIVDGWAASFGVEHEANMLSYTKGLSTFTTTFGRGIIDETSPNSKGVYHGLGGNPDNAAYVQSCDLIIRLAPLDSDFNTCFFTTLASYKPSITIDLHQDSVSVCGETVYPKLQIKSVLQKLLSRLEPEIPAAKDSTSTIYTTNGNIEELQVKEDRLLNQDTFWKIIPSTFKSGDTILLEAGTTGFATCMDYKLPPTARIIVSSIWLSIGHMLPACAGIALARQDIASNNNNNVNGREAEITKKKGRTILFEGDGSLQMTVQAISDMIRNRLDVTIFVINNDGYTIERYIHGMTADYNWIQPWRYLDAVRFFGADLVPNDDDYPVFVRTASTISQLQEILGHEQIRKGKGFNLVEVIFHKEDAPEPVQRLIVMDRIEKEKMMDKGKKHI